MNNCLLGQYLRKLRKEAEYTQIQIEKDGMISQSRISRIEKGESAPTVEELHYLSRKYGFTMLSIEELLDEPDQQLDYQQYENRGYLMEKMENALLKDQFKMLQKYRNQAASGPLFKHPREKLFLERIEGILQLELYQDYEKAYHHFQSAKAIGEQTKQKEKMAETLNSIGILYIHQGQLEKAKHALLEAQKLITPHPRSNPSTKSQEIHTRILYNLSIVTYQLENFQDSIQYCYQTKKRSQDGMSALLIGEATYQLGLSQYYTGNEEEARSHIQRSIVLFETYEKYEYKIYAEKKVKELKL
ncbi:helix-turn-helix transcriptional regulator [Ammoniphilus sp. YIM 78166]|uniref:helix-turn-helix domain-containing protein n=1 Tax=Ammoniphilus sp. YIM 78166 TaxID=1644106 RepID=UPI00143142A6|nr:helix-turn-helix transcriptional regulator [Ammoniphilus sp. YIM 78166]